MTAISNTPVNKNFLSPLGFKFQIKKTPYVNFFMQEVDIPGITLSAVDTPNPFVNIPQTGDHILYEPLSITFKVDEDLQNYLEIHNWIKLTGKPQTFDQYRTISQQSKYEGEGLISDVSVFSTTSSMMPNYEIVFVDAFPITLSGLSFNSTDEDVNYINATATFKYTYYNINKI